MVYPSVAKVILVFKENVSKIFFLEYVSEIYKIAQIYQTDQLLKSFPGQQILGQMIIFLYISNMCIPSKLSNVS